MHLCQGEELQGVAGIGMSPVAQEGSAISTVGG